MAILHKNIPCTFLNVVMLEFWRFKCHVTNLLVRDIGSQVTILIASQINGKKCVTSNEEAYLLKFEVNTLAIYNKYKQILKHRF